MHTIDYTLPYLLWQRRIKRRDWVAQLALWIGCDHHRAADLLRGAQIEEDELKRIEQTIGSSWNELKLARLIANDGIVILTENLNYLLTTLDRGQKKALANHLRVHPTTVSRWRNGHQHPAKEHLDALCRYFGLSHGIDLHNEAIFLSALPVSVPERRTWLRERIAELDAATLQSLFPALQRLLEQR
jgi:hypothetical protein